MNESAATWDQLTALAIKSSDKLRNPRDVRPETCLMTDLGLSSLMAVCLIVDLEQEFNIMIEEQDFANIKTVGDLKRLIDVKRVGVKQ